MSFEWASSICPAMYAPEERPEIEVAGSVTPSRGSSSAALATPSGAAGSPSPPRSARDRKARLSLSNCIERASLSHLGRILASLRRRAWRRSDSSLEELQTVLLGPSAPKGQKLLASLLHGCT